MKQKPFLILPLLVSIVAIVAIICMLTVSRQAVPRESQIGLGESQVGQAAKGTSVTVAETTVGPTITSVGGTFTHGSTVTISGSGFGAKANAAPVKFDNFESGTPGNDLSGWAFDMSGPDGEPEYSATYVRPNSARSAKAKFDSGRYLSAFGIYSPTDITQVYIDTWYLYDPASPPSRNHKLIRLYANQYDGMPNLFFNIYCHSNEGALLSQSLPTEVHKENEIAYTSWTWSSADKHWVHLQMYFKENSAPMAEDGVAQIYIDGVEYVDKVTFRTRDDLAPSMWHSIWLGNYLGHDAVTECPDESPGASYTYWDDTYVDYTRARVEIGNAATYDASTHREIQIPQTTWSPSSIIIKLNTGSFPIGSQVYLYVTDASGNVNANGFPITIGGGQLLSPVAAFVGVPTSGNAPLMVAFTDQSSNGPTSWLWNFGDGTTSTIKNPGKIYTASGTYTVTLTATNAQGSDGETKMNYITVSGCTVDNDCNSLDNLPCVDGRCVNSQCVATFTTSVCNDNIACTIGDVCGQGTCSGTAQMQCAHGDGCCPSGCTYTTDHDCANPASLCDGLVMLLPFDDATPPIIDETGRGHDARCTGTCPSYTSGGRFGGAYSYVKIAENKFDISHAAEIDPDSLTVSVWFKRDGLQNSYAELLVKGIWVEPNNDVLYPWSYAFEWSGPTVLKWSVNDNTNDENAIATPTIVDNSWTNLVGTYVSLSRLSSLYVNGVLQGSLTLIGTRKKATADLTLGHYGAGQSGGAFNGIIDEVAVWDRPLSSAEVVQLQSQSLYDLCVGSQIEPCDFNGELVSLGSCSVTRPWFCSQEGVMVQDCQECNCMPGSVCQASGICKAGGGSPVFAKRVFVKG
jgi:PKD repeat protein